jgi:hypothetical protein
MKNTTSTEDRASYTKDEMTLQSHTNTGHSVFENLEATHVAIFEAEDSLKSNFKNLTGWHIIEGMPGMTSSRILHELVG